jgi:hypothetical protein
MAEDFWAVKFKQAIPVGSKVREVFVDEEGFIGIIFTRPDGTEKHIWLLSDEEGNGPGRFEVGAD